MATESRIRIIESSNKWPSCEDAAACWQSSANMAVEELGLVMRNQRFQGNGRNMVPNRSESAPPSMEGSLTAVHNLVSQQKYIVDASLPISNNAAEGCEPAEEFRVNSAYLSYYSSNTDLNARTRPPLISLENQRSIHHIGSIGNNWRLTSFDDTGTGSLRLSCSSLPIHEEETEEDRSSHLPPDEWAESSSEIWSRQEATLSGQPSSLIDLLQENASHSSSPVYNKSRSISYESVQVDVDCDAESSSLHNASVSTSNANASIRSSDNKGLTFYADAVTAPVSGSLALSSTGAMPAQPPIYKRHLNARVAQFEDKILNSGLGDADFSHIESQMKNMGLSSLPTAETHNNQKDRQYGGQVNLQQSRSSGQANMQHRNTHCVQGVESQIISQGLSHAYMNTNQVFHGPSNFSAAEARPIMQPSGFTPLYGTAAAYITSPNPLYPNEQPSGYFSPQYNISGYAFNPSDLPPFVAGYAPHSAIPVAFNATSGISFSPQTSGIPSGGSAAHVVDVQHLNKFYTQFGYAMQPSFPGALHMQYFQHPFGNAYGMSGQFDHLASRHSPLGSQVTPVESQKGAELASDSQKILHHGTVGYGNLNTRSGGFMNNYYSGGPTTICTLMPFQNSPVPSPVLPGSSGGKTEARLPPGVGRNSGIYSGWQGQGIFGNTKRPSILEELKSGKGRRFELSDIAEHVIEFSADQHGSRFIQQKLENCSPEEKASVFKEVLPHASKLMTDVFGNYVIQKFFEYGSPDQRRELANQLEGQILPLSLQMYGCRVIQKALEVIELKQKTKLVRELDGHVMRCVHDQNGNHVIQKCIESIPTDKIAFIISSFRNQVATLSTHPYGCRVIQRVLEHCSDELQSQFIVDEILESVYALAQDQYGNYVTQHVLERGRPNERSQIISKLSGHIVQLSQHKFASNVIEKSLEHSDLAAREILIGEIIGHGDGNDNLLIMMKDQYANYVVQKILKMCSDDQREMLLPRVRVHLNALKKYTYGKHIVARFEQLYGQEIQTLGS